MPAVKPETKSTTKPVKSKKGKQPVKGSSRIKSSKDKRESKTDPAPTPTCSSELNDYEDRLLRDGDSDDDLVL